MPKTTDKNKYFVVRERAVPEVLLNVVAAKKLLESKRVATVQEAADAVGISRSSFYKYKDDIFPFHEEAKAILPCFRYKIQCYGYFSCLITCTSGILYLLYGLNIRE